MNNLVINIKVHESLYLKDPQTTDLGKRIIEHSVLMIDKIGLECFTFGKLSKVINAAEPSIYRYFENKHQLFVYLLNWYWEWMAARIELNTMNITSAAARLKIVLNVIADAAKKNSSIEFVDEEALHRIVVTEGAKGYHHKMVDADNKEGFFLACKRLCEKIADLLIEVNPNFPYPRSLASSLLETANSNLYFAKHLPRLTDVKNEGNMLTQRVKDLLEYFCFGILYAYDFGKDEQLNHQLIATKKVSYANAHSSDNAMEHTL